MLPICGKHIGSIFISVKMPVFAGIFCWGLSDLADGILCVSFAEEQGNAPDSRQCDDRINDAAEYCVLTAEDPCDKVKLEKTDATPVQSTNDRQNK